MKMNPRKIFRWVIYSGRHCRRVKIFYLPQPGIEPRSLDLQANTLPRRCKSQLPPQGSRSVYIPRPCDTDNHSPERGLIEGPTFLSYEFQQVLIQWDWKVLRCCFCFFLCFSFLFSSFFSLSGVVSVFFVCFFFYLVAAVHRASLSPQQQNKC